MAEGEEGFFDCPIVQGNRFRNPFDTWRDPELGKLFKFLFRTQDDSDIPSNLRELNDTLPVIKPDFNKLKNPPPDGVQVTWIGHASVYAQLHGLSVLTDPIFSDRCSPVQFIGTKRFRPVPCSVAELPSLDAVVVSHDHYDHLDHASVVEINRRFPDVWWYVPMNTRRWMLDSGCKNVVELTWWQEHKHNDDVTFVCTPSQHWCTRSGVVRNTRLWGSWLVKGPHHSFYFAGDTGYCRAFKDIGQRYGPITLAAIPIGAYHPREFLSPQHVDPGQAVQIHQDIRAQNSVGIHWGTFRMTKEHYLEPREHLKKEISKKNLQDDCFITVRHGDVHQFKDR